MSTCVTGCAGSVVPKSIDFPCQSLVRLGIFSGKYPARSAPGTNGLALGAQVEVECIAHKGK